MNKSVSSWVFKEESHPCKKIILRKEIRELGMPVSKHITNSKAAIETAKSFAEM